MNNPLLQPFTLPPFSIIKPQHMDEAVKKLITECKKNIKNIIGKNTVYTWDNFCQPIEEFSSYLNSIISIINQLNAVKNCKELRIYYKICISMFSAYQTWFLQNKNLYKGFSNLKKGKQYLLLNIAQKKTIDNNYQKLLLTGNKLTQKEKKRYAEIIERLSAISNQYSNNVLDATQAWSKIITNKNDLKGVPKNILINAYENAKKNNIHGWLVTLEVPTYHSIITFCENAALRKEIYWAYSTRASDQGPDAGKWDNSNLIQEILNLRYELAHLLGFNNYAEKALINKMAGTPSKIISFLDTLLKYFRIKAEKELNELHLFVKKNYGIKILQPWDIIFYSEKQKEYLYGITNDKLRYFFPEQKVLQGMFEVVRILYGIKIKQRHGIDVWHHDVRFFDIFNKHNELLGSFYLDLYARKNKISGAWMDVYLNRMRKSTGEIQKPIAYLNTNLTKHIMEEPVLLNHNEIITLFHEFGHCLHHLLTEIDISSVSGINGVALDAIEFPSQFMENWCWEPETLLLMSGHYKTGELISINLINQLLATKNYQCALSMIRQLELSILDIRLHIEANKFQNLEEVFKIMREVKKKVTVIAYPEWNRLLHSFNHIFVDEYGAGYYSYLWAKNLAIDAFSRFKKEGIFNPDTGKDFFKKILRNGGVEDPVILFKRFLGREPQLNSLLSYYDIS
ncbi:MAG: M3 family metallopeptidase [Candidatus Dasytiphilus stammeri]